MRKRVTWGGGHIGTDKDSGVYSEHDRKPLEKFCFVFFFKFGEIHDLI